MSITIAKGALAQVTVAQEANLRPQAAVLRQTAMGHHGYARQTIQITISVRGSHSSARLRENRKSLDLIRRSMGIPWAVDAAPSWLHKGHLRWVLRSQGQHQDLLAMVMAMQTL